MTDCWTPDLVNVNDLNAAYQSGYVRGLEEGYRRGLAARTDRDVEHDPHRIGGGLDDPARSISEDDE